MTPSGDILVDSACWMAGQVWAKKFAVSFAALLIAMGLPLISLVAFTVQGSDAGEIAASLIGWLVGLVIASVAGLAAYRIANQAEDKYWDFAMEVIRTHRATIASA